MLAHVRQAVPFSGLLARQYGSANAMVDAWPGGTIGAGASAGMAAGADGPQAPVSAPSRPAVWGRRFAGIKVGERGVSMELRRLRPFAGKRSPAGAVRLIRGGMAGSIPVLGPAGLRAHHTQGRCDE